MSGKSGLGKTTSLESLRACLAVAKRVTTIEDLPELLMPEYLWSKLGNLADKGV